MKILALETTEKFGSAALLDNGHVLAEIELPKDRRSSQTLHPVLQSLFDTAHITASEIDIVAVVAGPGSFTGLRVGVTTAKVFAYITGAKVIALDTFETVAFADTVGGSLITVGVDAQRGEVVAAVLCRRENGQIEIIRAPELIAVADWWKYADQYDAPLFSGPALERWSGKAPSHVLLAPDSDWLPKASAAGTLAARRMSKEQPTVSPFDNVWTLLPTYFRPSAAEEKRQELYESRQ